MSEGRGAPIADGWVVRGTKVGESESHTMDAEAELVVVVLLASLAADSPGVSGVLGDHASCRGGGPSEVGVSEVTGGPMYHRLALDGEGVDGVSVVGVVVVVVVEIMGVALVVSVLSGLELLLLLLL